MPYIHPDLRIFKDKLIEDLVKQISLWKNIGNVNYIITKFLLARNPRTYRDFNEIIGVLECVKQEFYRRMIVPYEDKKKEENGDVFNE